MSMQFSISSNLIPHNPMKARNKWHVRTVYQEIPVILYPALIFGIFTQLTLYPFSLQEYLLHSSYCTQDLVS